jgi:RHS repeat-associated protein
VGGYALDDKVRQKFTGQPRDSESGLDFFGARYASAAQGRFTGADAPLVAQWSDEPQSWHLYAYTSNNPVNRVDPNGQDWFTKEGEAPVWIPCDSKGNCAVEPPEGYERWVPDSPDDTLPWHMGPVTFFLRADGRYDYDAPLQDISWETAGQISMVMGGARLAWGLGRAGLGVLAARRAGQSVTSRLLRACFVAGTLVATAQGDVPIERIAPGDLVTSVDLATRALSERRVSRTFERDVERLLVIDVAGEGIRTTDEHPFWVEGAGWTRAGDLRAGDRLVARDGATWDVEAVRRVDQPERVYNLEIEAPHTYFVSARGVLVHNKSVPAAKPSSSLTKPSASWLKRNGVDPHTLKSEVGAGGESDIFKDAAGNLWLKVKGAADDTAEFVGHISDFKP